MQVKYQVKGDENWYDWNSDFSSVEMVAEDCVRQYYKNFFLPRGIQWPIHLTIKHAEITYSAVVDMKMEPVFYAKDIKVEDET